MSDEHTGRPGDEAGEPPGDRGTEEHLPPSELPLAPAEQPPAQQSGKSRTIVVTVIVTVLVIAGAVFILQATDDELGTIAEDTCEDLEGAIVLQAGGIIQRAVDDAEDVGATGPELGDRMREICPGVMRAIENIGEQQEERDRLPSQMELDISACETDEVRGRITNNSGTTVDVYIDVILYRGDLQVDDGLATVRNLAPGRTATWETSVFERYTDCRAAVSSVFEAD